MNYGYVSVGSCSPELRVADVKYNADNIIKNIKKADEMGVDLLVFPELAITGATCGDLFFSDVLINGAERELLRICESTKDSRMLVFIGMPLKMDGRLYNVSAAINCGNILGFVPCCNFPSVDEIDSSRYFSVFEEDLTDYEINGEYYPVSSDIIFKEKNMKAFTVSAEIGGDIFSPLPPAFVHAVAGANIVVGQNAMAECVGRIEFRENLVKMRSYQCVGGYIYSEAGKGESTTDMVFGGHNLIAENGKILKESRALTDGIIVSEIDLSFIEYERSKRFNGESVNRNSYITVEFVGKLSVNSLTRTYKKTPFVPETKDMAEKSQHILDIQAEGLKKRIEHSHAKTVVIGLSGGLDSTLAIIVAVTAMKKLNRPLSDVLAVTMPCFGTTSRTFQNTLKLGKALGVTLKKVDISKCVTRHLKDIHHPEGVFDVTFENAQARERTQVLMDLSNMYNGLVVGTGDLSEVALGWSTYNGDHMSMYGVNCSVPKTLVRHIVEYYASISKGKLKSVLADILDTPVSPELLPAENDAINQKTEDIVGPYILHDFFLYNMIRRGFSPEKLYFVACQTFDGDFKKETILKWLKIFTRRFFNQQFKRSCIPDGVKIGSVALSPRGSWKMPSDAMSELWLNQLENL